MLTSRALGTSASWTSLINLAKRVSSSVRVRPVHDRAGRERMGRASDLPDLVALLGELGNGSRISEALKERTRINVPRAAHGVVSHHEAGRDLDLRGGPLHGAVWEWNGRH